MEMRGPILIAAATVLSGCTTYLIPVESLHEQLGSATMTPVVVEGPMGSRSTYDANDIRTIHCITKDGEPHELGNSPSIETRFTTSEGKRHTLYFDRLMLKDDTLIGSPSRFAARMVVKIPFTRIEKVEVQDGKKDFFYVGR